ncbi:OLC1v1008479C2 [Oldenlandia corymbosa var. corymbosa]|uniref:OLC1v1008479C2 n=1 Tax=Oldenlandia corymbosa var. corymbosa TaxID=529605 RepID=A0AAV1DLQ1_OLDCO|nr:OLC1v1008479C2 [Oldenlandia corymbosa var. corymbosa]
METSVSKPSVPATIEEPHLDLYTIPSYSSWFQWGNIHEIERISLREFFDGTSITRTPRIYKEYRDFIICRYREDPSRKLTFTDIRKSLVGDVSTLHKVFTFLEKWGLINFDGGHRKTASSEEEDRRVRVEEGAPHGVKVVLGPNQTKIATPPPPPLPLPRGSGSKFAAFASYSDVYGEKPEKDLRACWSCKKRCDSGLYQHPKEWSFILCKACFENGDYGRKSVYDFKFIDDKNEKGGWTEAETLLLLESVLKHGDDWELVAQNVKTKTKLDCISKLLQLPFGNLMLGSGVSKSNFWEMKSGNNNIGHTTTAASKIEESCYGEDKQKELKKDGQQNIAGEDQGPPQKRLCSMPELDASSYLMKQVARLSATVGQSVTASAADAAVAELCYENRCSRVIFDDDNLVDESKLPAPSNEEERFDAENANREREPAISELQETTLPKNVIPLTLRMRAATATSLGVAASHAKLLADQEEREIENLMATLIETQACV